MGVTRYPMPIVISHHQQPPSSSASLTGSHRTLATSSTSTGDHEREREVVVVAGRSEAPRSSHGQLSARSLNSYNSAVSSLSSMSIFNHIGEMGLGLPFADSLNDDDDDYREILFSNKERDYLTRTSTASSSQAGATGRRSSSERHLSKERDKDKERERERPSSTMNPPPSQQSRAQRGTSGNTASLLSRSEVFLPALTSSGGNGSGNAFAPTSVRLRTADSNPSPALSSRIYRNGIDPYNSREVAGMTLKAKAPSSAASVGAEDESVTGRGGGSSMGSRSSRKGKKHRSRSPKPIALSIAALQKAQQELGPILL